MIMARIMLTNTYHLYMIYAMFEKMLTIQWFTPLNGEQILEKTPGSIAWSAHPPYQRETRVQIPSGGPSGTGTALTAPAPDHKPRIGP